MPHAPRARKESQMSAARTNPLKGLQEFGQSVWLDFVSRELLRTGGLAALVM